MFAGRMPDIGVSTYGTYPDIAALLDSLRAEISPTVFAFGGGSLGPSPLSSLDKGSHIIDILNTLEPDLMTLTKQEFSYFEDELTLRSYEAAFPIVSSNLYDPLIKSNLEGILTSLIVEKNNVKIGFLSILDEEVIEQYLLKRIKVFEPQQIIQQQIAHLKQQGAELIVLIYSKERDYYQSLLSEHQINFALRVSSTSESRPTPSQESNVFAISSIEPIILLRISWNAGNLEESLDIKKSQNDISFSPSKPTTSILIDEYNQRLNRLLNQKIGIFGVEILTSKHLIRTKEMPFGNFVADALKHYAKADIGMMNSGGIRGDKAYTKGTTITLRDIATEIPFRSHIAVLSVTGKQVKQALENSVSTAEDTEGRFLQVSGLSFTYSINKPIGERVQSVYINGKLLDPVQKYSVATTDYLAKGGDGYDAFINAEHLNQFAQNSPILSYIVTRMIQQQKTISPVIENRILQVTE